MSRRVIPLVVDASAPAVRTQPPPPKTPLHRAVPGNDVARPPTGGSVGRGFLGFDRLAMMRQVNAATGSTTTHTTGAEEVSAAVNHRQRMAAEQQRRMEVTLMGREDYIGTPEGQERLQRQEERSRMREEELLVLRLVEAERQAARALQRERELEEERRVREQYLAKIRAQREQQEKEAREKEEKRKLEMEKKMRALKEAADAKARAEYAAKQSALEEEARLAREKHSIAVETALMQVEDAVGHAMQQEAIAERERQRQIAAEQEEWRAFQERENEKQREATQLRRAAMAQQYEQDKQRRLQIHKLQKERAAQQAALKHAQNRQVLPVNDNPNVSAQKGDRRADGDNKAEVSAPQDHLETETVETTDSAEPTEDKSREVSPVDANDLSRPQLEPAQDAAVPDEESTLEKDETVQAMETTKESAEEGEQVQSSADCDQEQPDPVVNLPVIENGSDDTVSKRQDSTEVLDVTSELSSGDMGDDNSASESAGADQRPSAPPLWSVASARAQGFVPFAQILSVMESSPAMEATLQGGDLLIDFNGIVSTTPKCLVAIAECVQKNVNNSIPVGLLRPVVPGDQFKELRVSLRPRKWQGKGLLGCQLSPYKWPEEPDPPQQSVGIQLPETSRESSSTASGDGASALVVYDVVAGSLAEQAGFVNGDILAGFDDMAVEVSVATIKAVVGHIRAARTALKPVQFDIHRWVAEDQCYRSLRIELPAAGSGSLGFSLTSFAEYYNYYSAASTTASACGDCYYTSLTTALHAAALVGHVSCLEALLDSLVKQQDGYAASDYLDWRDEDGRTPLFYACYAGQLDCVQYLLRFTASVSADLYGDTVLHAATTSGNLAVISLVLESGCVKVDERNHGQLTCAHIAPNTETLSFLGEQAHADLLATDSEERMPLAYACLRSDVASIEYLCKKHPDFVDYADVRGNTPLHVAAWQGLREAVEVLLRFLPSIALYITNEDGKNAAEMARSSGMEEVATFLESAMTADSNPP